MRIHLEIPDDMNAHPFWPWREREIANLFNSCPPGDYYIEAWVVRAIFRNTKK